MFDLAVSYFLAQATDEVDLYHGELLAEADNLRAAHTWAVGAGEADVAMLTAAAASNLWSFRGGAPEALERCEAALGLEGGTPLIRCACRCGAARAAECSYETTRAWDHGTEALALLRAHPDEGLPEPWVWQTLCLAALGHPDLIDPSFETCLEQGRAASSDQAYLDFLDGVSHGRRGDFDRAIALFDRARTGAGASGDASWVQYLDLYRAKCGCARGDFTELPRTLVEEVEASGDVVLAIESREVQAALAAGSGRDLLPYLEDALRMVRHAGLPIGPWADAAAAACWFAGDPARALTLWGARDLGQGWSMEWHAMLEPQILETLDAEECSRLLDLGAGLHEEEVIALVVGGHDPRSARPASPAL